MNFKILTDKELSDNIKNKKYDNESLKELINRHSNLVIYMINSIMSDKDRIFNKNQILDEKDFFIYKTALKFNDKNKKDAKFSTLLGNEVKWACLNTYNRKKDKPNKQIEDIPDVSSEEDLINDVECKDNLLLISKLINKIETNKDIELIAIGIGHDVTRYYKRAVTIIDVEELGGVMTEKLAELFDENQNK